MIALRDPSRVLLFVLLLVACGDTPDEDPEVASSLPALDLQTFDGFLLMRPPAGVHLVDPRTGLASQITMSRPMGCGSRSPLRTSGASPAT